MDEQRIRKIIREELAAHEERLKSEQTVVIQSPKLNNKSTKVLSNLKK